MYYFDSYPAGFRITPGFVQVAYENLSPRCVHGHLHPPALEYCIKCFPDGRHFNCAECEAHPLLEKPAGQDFGLEEYREIEAWKLRLDQHSFVNNDDVRLKLECFKQYEINNYSMQYNW
ncbi:hypothetical protein E8E11_003614 [Didymella keratinophila]|nr:hypothetical protein E8E11_003614 [Didymella keratinophila]